MLFTILYEVVLTYKSINEKIWRGHSNKSYWAVLCYGTVYYNIKVILIFESANEILRSNHSYESYWAVLACGAVYYALLSGFESMNEILKCGHSDKSYWAILPCGAVYYAVQGGSILFECVDEILKSDHSSESYWTVLSYGAVCYTVQRDFVSVDEIFKCDHSYESYLQYFPVVLFITLNKVDLTSPKAWPFNKSYWAVVLSVGVVLPRRNCRLIPAPILLNTSWKSYWSPVSRSLYCRLW